jgi:hypothetical protein
LEDFSIHSTRKEENEGRFSVFGEEVDMGRKQPNPPPPDISQRPAPPPPPPPKKAPIIVISGIKVGENVKTISSQDELDKYLGKGVMNFNFEPPNPLLFVPLLDSVVEDLKRLEEYRQAELRGEVRKIILDEIATLYIKIPERKE